jgi:SAM-dependent methyltransferase
MTLKDDHRSFWEQRLATDWTESGVGYHALGRPFNSWMYRVRREVFIREASALGLTESSRILDVGSGTGFYVRCWKQVGVGDVVGSDLTEAAVEQLRAHYPGVEFMRLDITGAVDAIEPASFDVVSCMDVLFHITNDDRYLAALDNVARILRPGGRFVFSENFLHRPPEFTDRQVNRTMEWIRSALRGAGFEIERRACLLEFGEVEEIV